MTKFEINIVSDTVCPWCYVGKKRLERAIAQRQSTHPEDAFSTTWSPFYLNPDAPTTAVDKRAYYASKYGAARAKMMHAHMAALGKKEGIEFSFGGRIGNTRASHRLIQLGKTKGERAQTRVVEELFASYFEKEEDITRRDVLAAAGARAGLDEREVADWLDSGKGGDQVDRDVAHAQKHLVTGVPSFTIQGCYHVHGAEEPAAFLRIFQQIAAVEARSAVDGVLRDC
ncbi:hypothetical protein LTR28_004251 [Elasticomyces elasticus]|nr:hypothetical protein LTR28_004251 [Elasticomyces elasticus]